MKRLRHESGSLWLTIAATASSSSSSSSSGAVAAYDPGYVLHSDRLFCDKPAEAVAPHCDTGHTSLPNYQNRWFCHAHSRPWSGHLTLYDSADSWDSYCTLFGVNVNGGVPVQSSNLWYLDSGATNHMTGHRGLFDELDESVGGEVLFGDGSGVKINGMGSILFKCKNGEPHMLSKVYFVPDLHANVISIGQLTEIGYAAMFEGGQLAVLFENKLLMSVKRSANRLYPIVLEVVGSAVGDAGQQEPATHGDLGVVVTPGVTPVGSPGTPLAGIVLGMAAMTAALVPQAVVSPKSLQKTSTTRAEKHNHNHTGHGRSGGRCKHALVNHDPIVVACHSEGTGWRSSADSNLKSKFWGCSIQLDPVGVLTLEFDDGEVFQWSKVTTSIYNPVLGKLYCVRYGTVRIQGNHEYSCKLKFKEQSIIDHNPHQVQGVVQDHSGRTIATLFGKSDECMHYVMGDCFEKVEGSENFSEAHLLWKRSEPPKFRTRYNFTSFAITLSMKEKLPPTESRLRPDWSCLENGEYERENAEKLRLEHRKRQLTSSELRRPS